MTLEERVRWQIGEEGPQLPAIGYEVGNYEERIDNELDRMSPRELLRRISSELEDANIVFPDR